MKAFVYEKYGPPNVLQLKEAEKPNPGEDELLIKVQATAINPAGTAVIAGFTTMTRMFKIMLLGTWRSKRNGQKIAPMNANINQKDLGFLKGLIEAGRVKPVIDRCYTFGQIPKAVAYLEKGHARGKVVINMR